VTHRAAYLALAKRAGNYLLAHLSRRRGGLACAEDIGSGNTALFHASLDNGAAGCGFFLHDLSLVTGAGRYQHAAENMAGWLRAVARTDQRGIWWYDQLDATSGRWASPREMSWHWGQAGIIAFPSRLSGWAVSMPVEEQSILPLSSVPSQKRYPAAGVGGAGGGAAAPGAHSGAAFAAAWRVLVP
jgi:hypothetical protein